MIKDVIVLIGEAQHGKDTAATILKFAGYQSYAAGTALKEEVALFLDRLNAYWAEGQKPQPNLERRLHDLASSGRVQPWASDKNDETREMLQLWGTELRRAQDPDYWKKKLIKSIHPDHSRIVITDCRFQDEMDYYRNAPGYSTRYIGVYRPNASSLPAASREHPSERWAREMIASGKIPVIHNTGPREFAERLYSFLNLHVSDLPKQQK